MDLARTRDYALIRAIATHPKLWDAISDDAAPAPDLWKPAEGEALWYVLAKDGDEALGFFLLAPENAVCWHVHTCLLPRTWGSRAREAARELVAFAFRETGCRRLVTSVPAFNRLALAFAKRAGMSEYGRNPRSYLKHGELHDQILLGLSKPE